MTNTKQIMLGLVAALALAVTGCSDDNNSGGSGGSAGAGGEGGAGGTAGSGGEGGEGGAGGGELGGGVVTAVHLAANFPTADDTSVAIFLDGVEVPESTIAFPETVDGVPGTFSAELPAGTYDIGLGLPGADAPALTLEDVTIEDGTDITAVAYSTPLPDDAGNTAGVFVFNTTTDGLAEGSARVFVAHGANNEAVDPVNVVTFADDQCLEEPVFIPDFEFETTVPAEAGLDGNFFDVPTGGETVFLTIGFSLDLMNCPPVVPDGGIEIPVTPDVPSILVAVDTDPDSAELDLALYGVVDGSDPILLPLPQ